MDRAARIPAVPIPSEMDPAAPRVTTLPPALDASADRPQTGDVPAVHYTDEHARVLLGDCARLIEYDADLGANLIITSPPYALGVDYGQAGYADDQPYTDYLAWVRNWATTLFQ